MTVTFNKLRQLKDSLPDGSMKKIANKFNLNEETVRNYFGAANYENGDIAGIHFEQGPDGGLVTFNDPSIINHAIEISEKQMVI